MADKPKITGLSFEVFAIVTFLILLPISTAYISALSNANSTGYDDITTENSQNMMYDSSVCGQPFGGSSNLGYDDVYSLTWIHKGLNSSYDYMVRDNIPSNEVERYESIYDPGSGNKFHQMASYCGLGEYIQRDDQTFAIGVDNHRWLNDPHYLHGNNPNYAGYIGYSGDEYSFKVNNNQMKYLDSSKDISALKFTFIDYQAGFSCDSTIFQDVSTTGEIKLKFNNAQDGLTYDNFDFNQVNSFKVGFVPNSQSLGPVNLNDFCHIGLEFNFDFTPIESIEIRDYFQNDYASMSLEVTLKDFEFDNVTALNITQGASNAPIPFTGDDNFGFNFEVSYVDTTRTNFFLSGGVFAMGIGLFALAISSTPYWNPVVNYFKPKGA